MVRSSIALLLSLQLLLAGVPWTIRTHWCGGRIADWSVLGGQPGCGMEDSSTGCPSDTPAIDGVPCCANAVLLTGAVPSFIKVVQEWTSLVPVAMVIPLFTTDQELREQESPDQQVHPPDIVPTGRDILVRVQRFLI